LLIRQGGFVRFILAFLALVEYVLDLMPNTPARTGIGGLSFRIISGAFVGFWLTATSGGSTGTIVLGAILGVVGALIGAFGGLNLRLRLIQAIGGVPAGLLEDLIAIVLAVIAVVYL
jgi:uncharacterized membrane protein